MKFAEKNKHFLIKAYTKEGKSTYEIAEELGTYSNKIIRALNFLGIERRDYSKAQKTALSTGRAEHPTEGKTPTEETKRKISRKMGLVWEKMDETERQRRINMNKAQWEQMSDGHKQEMRRLASVRLRETAKEGSAAEKFVRKGLVENGYEVKYHVKDLIPDEKLEIDILVPGLKVAIEIDGPTHFLPIWGEEKLAKTQRADAKKGGLLISKGFVLIRVKQTAMSLSQLKKEKMLEAVLAELQKIEKKFPGKHHRLIEIEID